MYKCNNNLSHLLSKNFNYKFKQNRAIYYRKKFLRNKLSAKHMIIL